jgi:Na+/H+-translocating membrane pyrophosphatase
MADLRHARRELDVALDALGNAADALAAQPALAAEARAARVLIEALWRRVEEAERGGEG